MMSQQPKIKKQPKKPLKPSKAFSIRVHLAELQRRLLIVLFFFTIGCAIAVWQYQFVLQLLLRPLHGPLYYTSPFGGISFIFFICTMCGILLAFPILLYEILKFIEPAFPTVFKYKMLPFICAGYILLLSGICFAYFFGLPLLLHFLSSFATGQLRALLEVREYSSFLIHYLIGYGILFELPLIIYILWSYHLPLHKLLSWQRYIIVGVLILTFLLTPAPDPLTQLLLALPIILLYYLTIGILSLYRVLHRKSP